MDWQEYVKIVDRSTFLAAEQEYTLEAVDAFYVSQEEGDVWMQPELEF